MLYFVQFPDGGRGTLQVNSHGGVEYATGACQFLVTIPWLEARTKLAARGAVFSYRSFDDVPTPFEELR